MHQALIKLLFFLFFRQFTVWKLSQFVKRSKLGLEPFRGKMLICQIIVVVAALAGEVNTQPCLKYLNELRIWLFVVICHGPKTFLEFFNVSSKVSYLEL